MRLSFSHIIYTNTWKIHVYPATILFGLTNIYLTILNLYPLPHQMKISNKNKKFLSNLLFSGKRKRTKEKFLRITENNKTKITIQQKQDFSRFLFYQNKILFFSFMRWEKFAIFMKNIFFFQIPSHKLQTSNGYIYFFRLFTLSIPYNVCTALLPRVN